MNEVLILNQDFTPISICSVQRAFLLVFLNKAELISSKEGKYLRSVSNSFPLPSVIRILNYANIPYKGVALTRHNIFKRDNNECQYCSSKTNLTLDHVVPRSKGGKTSWTNIVTACKSCNSKKGDLDLSESDLILKRKPSKPSYILFLKSNLNGFHDDWEKYLLKK